MSKTKAESKTKKKRNEKSTKQGARGIRSEKFIEASEKTQFKEKNKQAEKWSADVVIEKLNKMMEKLTLDDMTQAQNTENPVRANNIKLFKEVCLCVGINSFQFTVWQKKFCEETKTINVVNETGELIKKSVPNKHFNPAVFELIQTIKDICECRLVYSGTSMDMFVLKNHYGFIEQSKTDLTSNGNELKAHTMPQPTAPRIVTIIESE
jgi:hypothetical protein